VGLAGRGSAAGAAGSGAAGHTSYDAGTCQTAEVCGNSLDDDCDGTVDEDCSELCEDTEGHNCNGDMGNGDKCAPEDNTHGCAPAKFWAWCNRRNDKYPNIWDDYLKQWVASRCDGNVTLEDPNNDGYPTFTCQDSFGRFWLCTTPLVLSFNPEVSVTFAPSTHDFALRPGQPGASPSYWPSAATPWLALDRDHNGSIDSGTELFGSSTKLVNGRFAGNGFEALAELDDHRDGTIDAKDGAWCNLLAWTDRNNDGVSQGDELASLESIGVISIKLDFQVEARCDDNGNCERERAELTWSDGSHTHHGAAVDVYLRSR
jgi:hypothetical protein